MSKITSPVLIIHGTEDEVTDFTGCLTSAAPRPEPLWVEGAGHNDIELYSQYLPAPPHLPGAPSQRA